MTALDAQVRATGLVTYKAVVDHAIEHGLPAPSTLDLTDNHIKVWLVEGKKEWTESIHVDAVDTVPGPLPDRVIVYVDGRLPFMNLKIRLAFAHVQQYALPAPVSAPLRVVGA